MCGLLSTKCIRAKHFHRAQRHIDAISEDHAIVFITNIAETRAVGKKKKRRQFADFESLMIDSECPSKQFVHYLGLLQENVSVIKKRSLLLNPQV